MIPKERLRKAAARQGWEDSEVEKDEPEANEHYRTPGTSTLLPRDVSEPILAGDTLPDAAVTNGVLTGTDQCGIIFVSVEAINEEGIPEKA